MGKFYMTYKDFDIFKNGDQYYIYWVNGKSTHHRSIDVLKSIIDFTFSKDFTYSN